MPSAAVAALAARANRLEQIRRRGRWRPLAADPADPAADPAVAGTLAGRAAHEIKLVGDVDQLTGGELAIAHGQPVGQVGRFDPIVATTQRVLDRAEDAAHEVGLIPRVAPVRAGA